ncbi:hypothetical protein DPMN_011471 [Dreissena polymorpha]|uniref:Uncharacterized protein n=1 Tax=Dreissena polymorpha TaxID=45954 RepID=A0A9D4N553_DREPO|nr:hypothetical protein DPMN_011471 [Dreissena polymorpha]
MQKESIKTCRRPIWLPDLKGLSRLENLCCCLQYPKALTSHCESDLPARDPV